jgi:uncharacterized repeat protein (TIGR01451 family)
MSAQRTLCVGRALTRWLATLALGSALVHGAWAQSVVFNATGSVQSYTVPAGATGIQIQANGAGGGGAGADENGPGGNGGAGASVSGVYLAAAGTVLKIYVGVGGVGAFTSNFGHTCTNSAGAGGNGAGGLGGGAGGQAGCSGWSGGGGGGGAASEVTTSANAVLLIAGGGSGGQGGSWNSIADPGQDSTAQGTLVGGVGSVGGAGKTLGNSGDGGGGGGGGGGCPGGAGGPTHGDNSGAADGTITGAGASCAAAAVSSFTVLGALGGSGGTGDVAATQVTDPGGASGGAGSVLISPLYPVSGTVYADTDHNATLDAGETGTGLTGLTVKLSVYSGGVCQNPAVAAAAVDPTNGAYTLASVATSTYCLTLTNSAALSNTTPYLPAGWVGTEAASRVRLITTTANPTPSQNFGLYNGSSLTLTTFSDTGAGAGTANDGMQNGGEAGASGVTVTASVGGSAIASAVSTASGAAVLWLPASTSGSVTISPATPSGALATGGSAGTTSGSYARPSVTFSVASGQTYSGVTFGLVPASALAPTGARSAQPGTTLYYPHTFTAGSAGQVTFAASAVASPAVSGWSQVLYLDSGCSGQFATGDPVLSSAIAVTAGQRVCLLVREFVPANAPLNADDKITLSASVAFSGSAAPAISVLAITDTTTVATAGALQLTKQVQNLTLGGAYGTSNTALPGNTLQYQLTVANAGSAALAAVVVDDATPAFTTFVSAACPASLPTGFTACSVSTKPAVGAQGALQWIFTGTLASGAQTAVTYQVVVAQ